MSSYYASLHSKQQRESLIFFHRGTVGQSDYGRDRPNLVHVLSYFLPLVHSILYACQFLTLVSEQDNAHIQEVTADLSAHRNNSREVNVNQHNDSRANMARPTTEL